MENYVKPAQDSGQSLLSVRMFQESARYDIICDKILEIILNVLSL